MGKEFDKYFGSNKEIMAMDKSILVKEIIHEYEKKSHARAQELLLQFDYRNDDRCMNGMWQVKLHLNHLRDFRKKRWKPKLP